MFAVPVTVASVEARPTAVIAHVTTWGQFPRLWPQLLDEVYRFVRSRSDLQTGAGSNAWQNIMLYRDGRPSVEIGVLVSRPFAPEARVTASQLPAGDALMAVHHGDYAQLGAAHDAVRMHAEAKGLELAGPRWEIYGHWRENPDELETEIYYLLG